MRNNFQKSLQLLKKTFSIVGQDKNILAALIGSGLSIVLAGLIAVLVYVNLWSGVYFKPTAINFGLFLLLGAIFYFIFILLNTAIIIFAFARIKGRDTNFFEGVIMSLKKFLDVLLWGAYSVIVSGLAAVFDTLLSQRKHNVTGVTWSFAVIFVMPIIIFEDKGPFAAIKGSVELLKNKWKEAVVGGIVGRVGLGLMFIILLPAIIGILILAHFTMGIKPDILFFLGFAFLLTVFTLNRALDNIYITALYHYTTTGNMPCDFSEDLMKNAFVSSMEGGNI